MPDHIVSLAKIQDARPFVASRVHRTPMLSSATAATFVERATGTKVADGRIYVKAEHLQKSGSFKPRGASWKIESLTPEERSRGIITFSAGNAAQGFAWAGHAAGVPVTVVMPAAAVPSKVAACRDYGAEVFLAGGHVGDALHEMERIRDARGLTYCHPFDDPRVIAGFGSIGLEILDDLPEVDIVVAGIGGGGLISGVAAALKESRPGVRVYGVEPERSNAMSLALERGEVVQIQPVSIADGLGAPFAGQWTLAMVRQYVDDIVLLDDPLIMAGMRFAAERMKQLLEPAGAAALAALLAGRIPIRPGDRVAVVASGGNVEISRVGEFFAGASALPGA